MSGVGRLTAATTLPSPGAMAAALLGALVVILALALLLRRRPQAFPLLTILALPFRVPIEAHGRTGNLLIPLYVVVAAGTVSWLSDRLKPREEPHNVGAGEPRKASLRRLSDW